MGADQQRGGWLMGMNFPTPVADALWYPPQGPIYKAASVSPPIWKKKSGTALPFNKAVNPVMQVSQQNGDATGTNTGYYMADQWALNRWLTAGGSVAAQRVAKTTPRGSKYRLRLTVTTPASPIPADNYVYVYQNLEGNRVADFNYGTALGLYGVVRFGLNAPAGTYSFSLRNSAGNCSLVIDAVIPPERALIDTEFSFVVPPCDFGTWATDNTAGMLLAFCCAIGTSMITSQTSWVSGAAIASGNTSNLMATAGNVFELFDVGLHLDPYQTGVAPEFQAPKYEDDLNDCLRYWYPAYRFDGVVNAATTAYGWNSHYVPMRSSPTFSLVGTTLRGYDVSTAPNITSIGGYNSNADSGSLLFTAAGGSLIPGRPFKILVDGTLTNYIAVSARM